MKQNSQYKECSGSFYDRNEIIIKMLCLGVISEWDSAVINKLFLFTSGWSSGFRNDFLLPLEPLFLL